MTSCTIIISHYESLPFLERCLKQIKKYAHPDIKQRVIVCDQSIKHSTFLDIQCVMARNNGIDYTLQFMPSLYSGFGIDYAMRYCEIKTDYIAQLHADSFPISQNWLYAPIKLIEEYEFSFVGQLQFVSDGTHSIYPPEPFCAIAQCYNVAKTETYRELSLRGGFTRFHNRPQSGLEFIYNDWADWAKVDYNKRGSDDDVVAFHLEDKYCQHNKLGLSITGMIGLPENGSSFGRVIDDLVFHWGSANEARLVMDKMPELYQSYTKKINEGFTDGLLQEILAHVNLCKSGRTFWDGTSKVASKANEDLNNRIEKLKRDGLE